jgi:hypothetical protein
MRLNMKSVPCIVPVIMGLLVTASFAQETGKKEGVRIGSSAVCTGIKDREPVGADSAFSADVGSLYCCTVIEGAKDATHVTHVWYYGEKKMAEISLAVKAARWRTHSIKKILPSQTGKWNVVILSESGDPLGQVSFTIKPQ